MFTQYNLENPPASRFTLMALYRMAMKQVKDDQESDEEEELGDLWSRISPDGNIYRLNGLESEHLKHRYDLEQQVAELAEEKKDLLDNALKQSGTMPSPEARVELLTNLLCKARAYDAEGGESGCSSPVRSEYKYGGTGFVPMKEFLKGGGVQRCWYLGGLLLPKSKANFYRQLKNRLLGLLIGAIQVLGPVMIFIRNWYEPTNYLRAPGGLQQYLTIDEILCFGDFTEFATTILGTLFLYIVFEVARGYTFTEMCGQSHLRYLPEDAFWKVFGSVANQTAILFTCLAMPLVFWTELAPKDIVFDSLAMLFIFSLDDLTGGALDYLNLSNEDFCKMRSCVTVFLGQCPVDLKDIINPDATSTDDIWQVRFGKDGLLSARTGKRCRTRLAEDETNTDDAEDVGLVHFKEEADSAFKSRHLHYTLGRGQESEQLPNDYAAAFADHLWHAMYVCLVVGEIIFPPIFLCVNDPCYS